VRPLLIGLFTFAAAAASAAINDIARSIVADRVTALTRASPWTRVDAVAIAFDTFHPQGMVKIGDTFFVSSVEVTAPTRPLTNPAGGYDRDAGEGVGHLFKIDAAGKLLADLRLGEGSIYHPGGIDYDGTHIWVPVAEYRPDSRSIIYTVDPATMKATQRFRAADHIGAIVHDTDDDTLHGVSWGSRRFYAWRTDGRRASAAAINRSHYIDYQDCKYAGAHRMLCTGVAEMRTSPAAPPLRLGGMDLVDLRAGRAIHQVPVPLWTAAGLDMTHNPSWIEPHGGGLRAYFMPDDNQSTLYVYDVPPK
jgi:uncharacterized protein DUF6454